MADLDQLAVMYVAVILARMHRFRRLCIIGLMRYIKRLYVRDAYWDGQTLSTKLFYKEIQMIKQLLLAALILVFSVSLAVAGCMLPKDTGVMMFTQGGMSRTTPSVDRPVVEVSEQPTAEMLAEFSNNAKEDWTDGVVVFDKDHVLFLLVHKKDLQGECEILEME